MLYMVRDVAAIEKDGKGWDFSNRHRDSQGLSTWAYHANQGMNAIVPFGPTTSAPPSG
jgi:hypothetical protein